MRCLCVCRLRKTPESVTRSAPVPAPKVRNKRAHIDMGNTERDKSGRFGVKRKASPARRNFRTLERQQILIEEFDKERSECKTDIDAIRTVVARVPSLHVETYKGILRRREQIAADSAAGQSATQPKRSTEWTKNSRFRKSSGGRTSYSIVS